MFSEVYEGSVKELDGETWEFEDAFYSYRAITVEDLVDVVESLDLLLANELKKVRLIVIDSLSSVFRDVMAQFGNMVRTENMLIDELVKLAQKFNILVSF